ncbi:DMT family transporter [Aquisalimonas asiatica]|uniref:Permease of the drug/metabolite transporter (DMT) superfamily n=1 Tax=Aquisalimonas asiatica TaxID=406100 RepID=A0A1H8QN53_9GAMM|nr:DMT family transporter [Aquisalimonas asiatica]SEO55640.1 Permease of the drug/metabolite transporter (DMT) superfamily [Aquisalimonas asiatica]
MVSGPALTGVSAGVFTVALWGSLPVLRSLAELPPMLVAVIAMACAAALSAVMACFQAVPAKQPAPGWRDQVAGVGGLVGALYFYFLALESGNPARITLITYTWPLGFVLICDRLAGRGLRVRTLLGSAVAFGGLAPLILADGQGIATPAGAYAAGLASGASWIVFSLFLRQAGPLSARSYRSLFAQAGLIALVLHLAFETAPAATTSRDWLTAALIGIGPYGLAFMAWGYALRRGPASLLGVLTYMVPVVAAVLLVALGWSSPSTELFIAAAAITLGALFSQGPWLGRRGAGDGRMSRE